MKVFICRSDEGGMDCSVETERGEFYNGQYYNGTGLVGWFLNNNYESHEIRKKYIEQLDQWLTTAKIGDVKDIGGRIMIMVNENAVL